MSNARSADWAKDKLEEHKLVKEIKVIDSNNIEIINRYDEKYKVSVISMSHITLENTSSLIPHDIDFLFNIPKEPLIDVDVLNKGKSENFGIGGMGDIMRALNSKDLNNYISPEVEFILNGLEQHTAVSSIVRLDNRRFLVNRYAKEPLTVLALNDYEITADIIRTAKTKFKTYDVILASNPNARITAQAKQVLDTPPYIEVLMWRNLLGKLNN